VALLSGDAELVTAVADLVAWYFSDLDFAQAGRLGSLTTAHATAVATARA
jgi:hypothetical protein